MDLKNTYYIQTEWRKFHVPWLRAQRFQSINDQFCLQFIEKEKKINKLQIPKEEEFVSTFFTINV